MSLRGHRIGSAAHVPIERYLIVGIDSQQFALSAELVQGLLTMEESGSVSTLMVQGQEYPSLDLGGRLGLAQAGDGPETRMVLVGQAGVIGYGAGSLGYSSVSTRPASVRTKMARRGDLIRSPNDSLRNSAKQ